MAVRRFFKRKRVIGLLAFLGWALVFGVIYSQSPLYTNNQNTYFLHGLAKAGFGYLGNDWLATRQEAFPVFSWLVYLTYGLFHSKVPFYFYYALLMGVYLFSMFGIMDQIFDLRRSKARTLAFVALFLLAHSAALRFLLSRMVSADSSFLFEGGVAGQRILGQVFQPSTFGVLLVLSIYLFLRERPFWSLVAIAVAITFHPVYLLGGALLTLAYMWLIFRRQHSWKQPLVFGATSLLLVSPALIYTISMFWDPSPALAREALSILVNFRNPQHALIASWLNWTVLVQAAIMLAALFILRKTKLFTVLVLVTAGVLLLTIIQVVTGSKWLALIFPWRVSVLLVPMGTTTLLAFGVTKLFDRIKQPVRVEKWITTLALLGLAGLMIIGEIRFQLEIFGQLADPALPMMEYVAAHKTPGEVYMTPSKMQNFRLVTGAPVLADFKSAPDRDQDVVDWYYRLQAVSWFYNGDPDPCKLLNDIQSQFGISHVVVQRNVGTKVCTELPAVYKDSNYVIYALPSNP